MMRTMCFTLLMSLLTLTPVTQQNRGNEQKNEVIVLITPQDKDVCLLSLNGKLYLTAIADIQLINKNDIKDIVMYLPGHKNYESLVEKSKIKSHKIMSVFEIELNPEVALPAKFVVK